MWLQISNGPNTIEARHSGTIPKTLQPQAQMCNIVSSFLVDLPARKLVGVSVVESQQRFDQVAQVRQIRHTRLSNFRRQNTDHSRIKVVAAIMIQRMIIRVP